MAIQNGLEAVDPVREVACRLRLRQRNDDDTSQNELVELGELALVGHEEELDLVVEGRFAHLAIEVELTHLEGLPPRRRERGLRPAPEQPATPSLEHDDVLVVRLDSTAAQGDLEPLLELLEPILQHALGHAQVRSVPHSSHLLPFVTNSAWLPLVMPKNSL